MAKMQWLEKVFVNSRIQYWIHKYFWSFKFIRSANITEPAKILEIGSGVGITSNFIAEKFDKSTLIATDFETSQIEVAKKKSHNANVTFQQADATKLSFPQASFDACFAILVFHHIYNFRDALKEIHRVLKPDGKLFIYDIPWKSYNPFSRWSDLGQPGSFTKYEFIQALKICGFEIIKVNSGFNFWIEAKK